jgi:hypothetical protein
LSASICVLVAPLLLSSSTFACALATPACACASSAASDAELIVASVWPFFTACPADTATLVT